LGARGADGGRYAAGGRGDPGYAKGAAVGALGLVWKGGNRTFAANAASPATQTEERTFASGSE